MPRKHGLVSLWPGFVCGAAATRGLVAVRGGPERRVRCRGSTGSLDCGRDSGENPERLRHCNRLQTSRATEPLVLNGRNGKAEARISLKSGYRFECARHGPATRGQLLRKEKDEASLYRVCGAGFL